MRIKNYVLSFMVVLLFTANSLWAPTSTGIKPDDSIDGYQALTGNWEVTGYEEYTNETIALSGSLYVKDGGHLVLHNCTLMMMSLDMLPYSIVVENGGTMELYDSNITDSPNDDDSEMLSPWYYFYTRPDSTFIMENTTIRQCGFMSDSNIEYMGLGVYSRHGYIKNSVFKDSFGGLNLVGEKDGSFTVENNTFANIRGISPIWLYDTTNVSMNGLFMDDSGDSDVVNVQNSQGISVSNVSVHGSGYYDINFEYCSDFTVHDIFGGSSDSLIHISSSHDFDIWNISSLRVPDTWGTSGGAVYISNSNNFTISDIYSGNTTSTVYLSNTFNAIIDNVNAVNTTQAVQITGCNNIDVSDITSVPYNPTTSTDFCTMWIESSSHIDVDGITAENVTNPLQIYESDNITFSNMILSYSGGFASIRNERSDDIIIRDSYFLNNSPAYQNSYGIYTNQGNTTVENVIVDNFMIGIYAQDGNINVSNITVDGSGGSNCYGIRLDGGNITGDMVLINNTIYSVGVSKSDDSHVEGLVIANTDYGVSIDKSNITLDNPVFDNISNIDLSAGHGSNVTLKNTTLSNISANGESSIYLINSVNTSTADIWEGSVIYQMWWVDVFVNDTVGPVAGANIQIVNTSGVEISGVTGSDGFARYLPVMECQYYMGAILETNPHYAEAYGSGWSYQNTTTFNVIHNMQVNVTCDFDTPPAPPSNALALTQNNGDTELTWTPSPSNDVVAYNISIVHHIGDLDFAHPDVVTSYTNYTHVDGSANWQQYYYGIKAVDGNGNESQGMALAFCGNWMIGEGKHQVVNGLNITLNGSLYVFGQLDISNSAIRIESFPTGYMGVAINGSGILNADNLSIYRGPSDRPYYFTIAPGAIVSMNNSMIDSPGNPGGAKTERGMLCYTPYLKLTNSTIIADGYGLAIKYSEFYSKFKGIIFNSTFRTNQTGYMSVHGISTLWLLALDYSDGVEIANSSFGSGAQSPIKVSNSTNVTIHDSIVGDDSWYNNRISSDMGDIYIKKSSNLLIYDNILRYGDNGIKLRECSNASIHNISSDEVNHLLDLNGSKEITLSNEGNNNFVNPPNIILYSTESSDLVVWNISVDESDGCYFERSYNVTLVDIFISNGNDGFTIKSSDRIYINNMNITMIYKCIEITDSTNVYIRELHTNVSFYGVMVYGMSSVWFENCSIKNTLGKAIVSQGAGFGSCLVTLINTTTKALGDTDIQINASTVLSLINTTIPLEKIDIVDHSSRVEIYWPVSVQVYNIEGVKPPSAEITIINSMGAAVLQGNYGQGCLNYYVLHQKTVFKEDVYLDNPFTIYGFDGSHQGVEVVNITSKTHIDLHVFNQGPHIDSSNIYGSVGMYDPTTVDDIILEYTYSDPEDDNESGSIIHWYINGIYNSTFDGMTRIDHSYTKKYQTWQAIIYPSDGYSNPLNNEPALTDMLYIEDTPPKISNVTITPANPTGGDDLRVSYDFEDIDGDGPDIDATSHKWYYYDEEEDDWIFSGFDTMILPHSETEKGEIWKCIVRPNDGDLSGQENSSQEVHINDTPPQLLNPKILAVDGSSTISSTDALNATGVFYDADGDSENGSIYEWYVGNGSIWNKTSWTGKILPSNYTNKGEMWKCRIVPSDGELYGSEVWTDPVEIQNSAPMVFNVTIGPENATSSDVLTVKYTFFDIDGDSENGTTYTWIYEDPLGTHISPYTGSSLPPSETIKGERWWCSIRPGDGTLMGTAQLSNSITIRNSPPVITTAGLDMTAYNGSRTLKLTYSFSDTDGDSDMSLETMWYLNGIEQSDMDNSTDNGHHPLVKGQSWKVRIRVFDGTDWSQWYLTEAYIIPNQAPYIIGRVNLTPIAPLSSQDLKPEYSAFDDDGDSISTVDVEWYKNNGHMEDLDGITELPADQTQRGEVWYCKIRISDGSDWSQWYESSTVLIKNSQPTPISLTPPGKAVTIHEGENIEFNISATDMDNDTLSYYWYLDGRIILYEKDISYSRYIFKTDYDSEGSYLLRLVVDDGIGTWDHTWDLTVLNTDRAPELNVLQPKSPHASIKEKETLEFLVETSDPDGDKTDVNWYLDGILVKEGDEKYIYTPDYFSSGTHNITAEVYEKDGNLNSTFTWSVDVKDTPQTVNTVYGFTWDQWGIAMDVTLAILSALAAVYGIIKYRKKKGKLREYLDKIDAIVREKKDNINELEREMSALKDEVRNMFSSGDMEENHYSILVREIEDTLRDIRLRAIESNISFIPNDIQNEVQDVLEDGTVTFEEYYKLMDEVLSRGDMTQEDKNRMKALMAKWMTIDKEETPEPPKKSESDNDNDEDETPPPPPPTDEANDEGI